MNVSKNTKVEEGATRAMRPMEWCDDLEFQS